jgi:DNA-binding SARP family transcriptional activator/tetratricopeptide (TPR) repeat protein
MCVSDLIAGGGDGVRAATSGHSQDDTGQRPEFAVLGSLEVRVGDALVPLRGVLQQRVLVMLLLEAGRVVPISRLVTAAWDEEPPDSARHQVRKTVAKLRSCIPHGHDIIVTDGPGYRAVLETEELDLLRYQRLLRQARQSLGVAETEQRAAEELRAALELWRGQVLAGSGGHVIDAAATALDEQRLAAAEQLYELRIGAGEAADLISELRVHVEEHPLRESLRARLMLALYHSGQQAAALDEFVRVRSRLADELGIDPGVELTELHERILRHDPSLSPTGPARSAPPASRGATGAPCTLPFDVRDFSGRSSELQWVCDAAGPAAEGAPTVLALDGMGGGGKTALAIRAAHQLAGQYPDGSLFIDLHGFTPGHTPLSAFHAQGDLLASAGLPSEEIPTVPAGRAARWQFYMQGRRMLVILDNAVASEQVRELIPASSDSLVLITSRPRLTGLDGAKWLTVGALPLSDSRQILRDTLGAERIQKEPEAARELLRLCGGLPLAVRIAAARLANRPRWSIQRLVERLGDHGRRLDELSIEGRGVAGALQLSYQSMADEQRTAFRLLGHHPGRYLDAEEAAALLDTDVTTAEDVLEELVDVRLLEAREPGVYALHDLVRSFVQRIAEGERAAEDGQAVRRLLDHYVSTAERACDTLFPGRRHFGEGDEKCRAARAEFDNKDEALKWLDQHRDSLLAAVDTAIGMGMLWHAARLPRELGFHSSIRAYDTRANAALEHGVSASRQLDDRPLTRLNLMNLAMGKWRLGQLRDAVARLDEAVDLSRLMGDVHSETECRARLGQAYNSLGELERALQLSQEASRQAKALGFTRLDGSSLSMLSLVQVRLGRFEEAAEAAEQAVAIFDSIKEVQLCVTALSYLSQALAGLCRFEEALARADAALERCRSISMPSILPLVLARRADVLVRMGKLEEAAESSDDALAKAGSTDDIHRAAVHLSVGRVRYARGALDSAQAQQLLAHEIACRMELRYDEACALWGLGRTAEAQGDAQLARRYRAAADDLFSLMKVPATAR